MKPIIPFEFEPCSSEFATDHLIYNLSDTGKHVSWPPAHVKIFAPPHDYYPLPEDLEAANPDYFRMYGAKGFVAGSYAEILVNGISGFASFNMGGIEVSFGRASPLAAYIFDYVHRAKYFGAWYEINLARIIGIDTHSVEAAFINACMHYHDRAGSLPQPWAMDDSFIWEEESEDQGAVTSSLGPIVKDLDPLRFYYFGVAQKDDVSACIYFYKTLEYFSFLMNQAKLTKIRNDGTISEADFAKRILDIVFKDEKGPILQMIDKISESEDMSEAFNSKLIINNNICSLGEAIYSFRNSIVHGKFSYRYNLQSGSVFDEGEHLSAWRAVLKKLAWKALAKYGSRLI